MKISEGSHEFPVLIDEHKNALVRARQDLTKNMAAQKNATIELAAAQKRLADAKRAVTSAKTRHANATGAMRKLLDAPVEGET